MWSKFIGIMMEMLKRILFIRTMTEVISNHVL